MTRKGVESMKKGSRAMGIRLTLAWAAVFACAVTGGFLDADSGGLNTAWDFDNGNGGVRTETHRPKPDPRI